MLDRYEPVIGLEIHAELMTNSKMFCGCRVVDSVEAPPNSAVCPVCLGMPGMLPVINRRAIAFAVRVALALNCTVQTHNIFARKNYFYPDLPKGYQVTQYELPIGLNGWLDVTLESGDSKRIAIRRVHIEEDTGKLTHLGDGRSLVDYNRSGVPLLEIVSEPDIRSGEEARAYAMRIRQILRYLGVNSGDMEKGVFRVEPNISIRQHGDTAFGDRVELKNLNSFRVLSDGTDFELQRQAERLDSGLPIVQETRGWHEGRRETFSQRIKEEAEDYRYFAEPDLPPLDLDEAWIQTVYADLPELPDAKANRYAAAYTLPAADIAVLTEDRATAEWYEAAVTAGGDPKAIANWVINELFRLLNARSLSVGDMDLTPDKLVALLRLVDDGTISAASAKTVLEHMLDTPSDPATLIAELGLTQISDTTELEQMIDDILANNPEQLQSYLSGKDSLKGWFVGQVMRATRGQANPAVVNDLLEQKLGAFRDANG